MANEFDLAELLECSSDVFGQAGNLANAFAREASGIPWERSAQRITNWRQDHEPKLNQLRDDLLKLADAVKSPIDGFASVAVQLVTTAGIVKTIDDAMRIARGRDADIYLTAVPDLASVAYEGWLAIHKAMQKHGLSNPFEDLGDPRIDLELPATLTKSDLKDLEQFRGLVNAEPFRVNGVEFDARSLKFITFAGAAQRERDPEVGLLFEGVFRFQWLAQPNNDLTASDFLQLPNRVGRYKETNLSPANPAISEQGQLVAEELTREQPSERPVQLPTHDSTSQHKPVEVPTSDIERGISLYDIAFAVEEDDSAATQRVKVWSDSKRILAQPIGRCPMDGRRQLYRLSELLSDVKKLLSLSAKEVEKYRQGLTAKLREPRES